MKVWVAKNSIREYEWEIIGVYDSEAKAEEATSGYYGANTVQEYEVE